MSYLERRTRKNRRAETPAQLHAWHCQVCMGKISQADYTARRNVTVRPGDGTLAFRLAHLLCIPRPLVVPRLGGYLGGASVRVRPR